MFRFSASTKGRFFKVRRSPFRVHPCFAWEAFLALEHQWSNSNFKLVAESSCCQININVALAGLFSNLSSTRLRSELPSLQPLAGKHPQTMKAFLHSLLSS